MQLVPLRYMEAQKRASDLHAQNTAQFYWNPEFADTTVQTLYYARLRGTANRQIVQNWLQWAAFHDSSYMLQWYVGVFVRTVCQAILANGVARALSVVICSVTLRLVLQHPGQACILANALVVPSERRIQGVQQGRRHSHP